MHYGTIHIVASDSDELDAGIKKAYSYIDELSGVISSEHYGHAISAFGPSYSYLIVYHVEHVPARKLTPQEHLREMEQEMRTRN